MPLELLYHPGQQAFLDALAQRTPGGARAFHRLLVISGRRGGKTKIGGVAAAREASVPNTLGWACAPSYPELHDYVIPALREALPPEWISKWSEQHQEFTLVNGSRIQCRSLDDPDRGRGPGLHWLWIDEGRKIEERAWDVLDPALRDKPGIAWVTSSPNGHDWLYRRLWKQAENGTPGYWAIKYKTSENPSIQTAELADAKASMDEAFYRQEYEADFVHFTGAVYGDLVNPQVIMTGHEKLVIPEWPNINPNRTSLCTIDPGTDHPFGAGHAVLTEQGLVWVGEYLERHLPIIDHAAAIKRMVGNLQTQFGYDRSARQIAIELAQHGINAAPCENSVEAGIRRVESWLRTKRMWFLESRVPRMIEQMRQYRWANNIGRDGQARNRERVFKVDDELPDVVRYAAMMWPELPEAVAAAVGRDPNTVPAELRWAYDREQRIAKWRPETTTGLGDFYGGGE